MTSIEKSNNSNLEDSIDYGDTELNELFKSLDEETKKKIKKYPKKDVQISILRNLLDPELNNLWNNLPEKKKQQLDSFGIRDRFIFLKDLLKKNKNKEKINLETKQYFSPHSPDEPPPKNNLSDVIPTLNEVNDEIFDHEELEETNKKEVSKEEKRLPQRLDNLVKLFYNTMNNNYNVNHELEVKFGTKGIKTISRNDYDNVVKKLKSSGFNIIGDNSGQYYLRINSEFLDISGRFKLSDVRTEIKGLHTIQEYCKNNDIKSLFSKNPTSIDFIHKKPAIINSQRVYPVDFDDFNFRVAYQTEEKVKKGIQNFIIENWKQSKKEFRFINRVSFEHADHPFIIDISISKSGNRNPDKYGRVNKGQMIRVYTTEESNVFNNPEVYEIEIEINNKQIGPATKFKTPEAIVTSMRKVIKYVLILLIFLLIINRSLLLEIAAPVHHCRGTSRLLKTN
jgi:hypothetical protein